MRKHIELSQSLSQSSEGERVELSQSAMPARKIQKILSQDAQRYDEYISQSSTTSFNSQEQNTTSTDLPHGLTYTQLENDEDSNRRLIENVRLREEIACHCQNDYLEEKYSRALRGTNLLLQDDSTNVELLQLRATINLRLDKKHVATEYLERILTIEPQNTEALELKASLQDPKANSQAVSQSASSNHRKYPIKMFDVNASTQNISQEEINIVDYCPEYK